MWTRRGSTLGWRRKCARGGKGAGIRKRPIVGEELKKQKKRTYLTITNYERVHFVRGTGVILGLLRQVFRLLVCAGEDSSLNCRGNIRVGRRKRHKTTAIVKPLNSHSWNPVPLASPALSQFRPPGPASPPNHNMFCFQDYTLNVKTLPALHSDLTQVAINREDVLCQLSHASNQRAVFPGEWGKPLFLLSLSRNWAVATLPWWPMPVSCSSSPSGPAPAGQRWPCSSSMASSSSPRPSPPLPISLSSSCPTSYFGSTSPSSFYLIKSLGSPPDEYDVFLLFRRGLPAQAGGFPPVIGE